jgi:Mn2+/Fe2+ NRAMP family transporter
MKRILEIFLGILTAMGGFVEIGELVFCVNAGAKFLYSLLWIVPLGTLGIIVYGEMSGRVAAVTKLPVFDLIRQRAGFLAGLGTLVAANLVCLMTCAAEIGGVAIILKLLLPLPYGILILAALLFFLIVVSVLSFQWIERVFGLLGLLMIIFLLTAYFLHPNWGQVASGFLPHFPALETRQEYFLYAYFAVALISSIMLPYETYFYASGAIEDGWDASYILINKIIVLIGFILGSLLAVALIILGAHFLNPRHIEPQLPGTAATPVMMLFGKPGLLIALLGMFFAFSGAAIETCFSAAYNLCQFMGWPWGKFRKPVVASRFTLSWMIIFVLAALIVLTGIDPVQMVEYSIVFSVIILPLSYFPVLIAAADERYMGGYKNGWLANSLGWFYLILVSLAGLSAIPLLVLTHGGKG